MEDWDMKLQTQLAMITLLNPPNSTLTSSNSKWTSVPLQGEAWGFIISHPHVTIPQIYG